MRRRDERGGVAVLTAAAVAVLVAVAAFAVDLGMQRVVRSDMQALADVVALDAARLLDGRKAGEIRAGSVTEPSLQATVAASVARNSTSLGSVTSVTATLVYVVTGTNGEQVPRKLPSGAVEEVADGVIPDGVLIDAQGSVDFAFAPGSGAAIRSAVAEASSTACYRLGSYVAAVRSGDSAVLSQLNDFLNLNLSVLSYQQIAAADLTLAQLAADPRIGSADQLLTGSVGYANLVNATIDALKKEPGGNTAAVQALSSFLALAAATPIVRVGDALSISPTDAAALKTNFSVLDLLAGTLMVANGEHAIEIPNIQAGVPGVGDVDGYLYVQQGPQLACGAPGSASSVAETSQVRTDASVKFLNTPSINITTGLLDGTLQTGKAEGGITISLGNATGRLSATPKVHCGAGTLLDPHTFSVDVTSGAVDYSLRATIELSGKLKIGVLNNVNITAKADITMAAPTGAPASTANLRMPPNDTVPIETGGDPNLLTSAVPTVTVKDLVFSVSALNLLTLGLSLSSLTTTITQALQAAVAGPDGFVEKTLRPFAYNLDNMLVNPVASLFGIRVGGADVYAVQAVCNVPVLRH
ncbi:pilus assembly protein TadG-related protein [Nocardioides sp.]|uniref:pilus assembly protein TadG-related protein n=1 Tax=Nocardioides sp. TaxID=35761 RepID=UPI00286D1704|nr:pilus assembly protein TadG-related protein [Nocardioides sp.]